MLRTLFIALLLLVGLAAPASAHAVLVGTNPPGGTVLETAPGVVTITFSEPTNPVVLRLTDPKGVTTELND